MSKILALLLFPLFLYASLERVSLQLEWKHQFEFAGFYAAIEQGYYKEVGIELELKEYEDGVEISRNVIDGTTTFGLSSSSLILHKLENEPIVLLASYFKKNALAFAVRKDIHTIEELRGKKIMALPYEIHKTSLGAILKEHNIRQNDYELIPHDYTIDKFIRGEVDAMSIFVTNQPYELTKSLKEYNIINPADFGVYSYDLELFTSQRVAFEKHTMVKNFINATKKGWEYAFAHKEEIVDLLYKKYSQRKSKDSLLYEAEETEKIFRKNIFAIGSIAPELIKINSEIFQKLGLIQNNLDINALLKNYIFNDDENEHLNFIKEELQLTYSEITYLKNRQKLSIGTHASASYFIDYIKLLASKLSLEVHLLSSKNEAQNVEKFCNKELDILYTHKESAKLTECGSFIPFQEDDTKEFLIQKDDALLISILTKAMKHISVSEKEYLDEKWLQAKKSSDASERIALTYKEEKYLQHKKRLTLCIDNNWLPFEALQDSKHIGMSADYFRLFQNRLKMPIELVHTKNWQESLEYAKERKCDILPLAMKTPQRSQYMNFTQSYLQMPLILATNLNAAFVTDFTQIEGKILAIPRGYAFNEILRQKYPKLTIIEVENAKDGLEKVRKGKIFGYIGTLASVAYLFQTEFTGELKIAGKFDEKWELGVAVRNDELELQTIFEKLVASITPDEHKQIFNKWIAINYEKGIDYALIFKILIGVFMLLMIIIFWNRKLSLLNKELQRAKERAEEATQVKANFLANVSHEIRTPMNSIVGMLYLVEQTPLNATQKEYVQKLKKASQRLLTLLNDILDFSKMEAKKLQLVQVDFNLIKVLDDLYNMLIIKAQEKNITLKINYEKLQDSSLYGDDVRLMQVLTNLLSNAIKFSQEGLIIVRVEQSENIFTFSIEDEGIGLTQEQQAKLFSSFTQADSSTTRKYGGTGLGLVISKQLVELMNGRIWLESQYNKGSKFIFEIPLQKSTTAPQEKKFIQKSSNKEAINTKPLIEPSKAKELFTKLKESAQKRRPQLYTPILKELEMYSFSEEEQKKYESVVILLKQYKFDEASKLL